MEPGLDTAVQETFESHRDPWENLALSSSEILEEEMIRLQNHGCWESKQLRRMKAELLN